jgi:hypothetical protein
MYIIGTSFGQIVKFESLSELEKVINNLQGMRNWANSVWEEDPEYPIKLAYISKPDNLSGEDKEWLDKFTDGLDNASRTQF